MNQSTIAIIYAMEKERATFLEFLTNIEVISYMNVPFYSGIYQSYRIVLAQCGVGKVNAAVVTTLLLDHFQPILLINSGIAGGYDRGLQPLDIIIADQVIYSDVDMTTDITTDLAYGQLQDMPVSFPTASHLIDNINTDDIVVRKLHRGTILTGDQFVTDYYQIDRLVHLHFAEQNVKAIDMESGAIAQVCYLYQTNCLIVRAISDVIGSNNPFEYQSFSTAAANLSCAVVKRIISSL